MEPLKLAEPLFIVTVWALGLESVKLLAKLTSKFTAALSPMSIPWYPKLIEGYV